MPETPERNIEQQLRASAQQRRGEASGPFELHPATRRLLQTEVARRFAGRGADSGSAQSWWLVFWPRVALGASLITLLGLCVWVSVTPPSRPEPDSDLARTPAKVTPIAASDSAKKLAEVPRADSPTPAATPAIPPAQSLALDETTRTERLRSTTADGESGTARKPITLPPESLTLVERSTEARGSIRQSQSGDAEKSQADKLEIASATPATDTNGRQEYQFQPSARARSDGSAPSGSRGGGGGGGFGGGGRAGRGSGMAGGSLSPAGRANTAVNAPATDEVKNSPAIVSAPAPGGTSSLYDSTIRLVKEKDSVSATSTPILAGAPGEFNDRVEPTNARFYRNQVVSAGVGGRGAARGGGAGGGGGRAFRSVSAPMSPMVLNSFRVEQSGDTLNIVDEDGSIYQGKVQAAAAINQSAEATAQLRRQPATPASPSKPGESPTWTAQLNFIVTGMNRSLAQGVVFTGQMQQVAPPQTPNLQIGGTPTPTRPAREVVPTGQVSADAKPASQAGAPSRIVGRAVVGQTNQLDVDALATPR